MKKTIWISFDLGVRGDYQGMYEFLDRHGAKECGDSLALLPYEFKKDLTAELTKDIGRSVKLNRRSRIYAIYPDETGRYHGRFIHGGRKSPPWTGFGTADTHEEDVLD